MNIIELKQPPTSQDKSTLIESITQLAADQALILKTPCEVGMLLEDLKKSRFQGLTWSVTGSDSRFETEIRNEDLDDDCCGGCGGS
jgi:hypothetical protein